MSERRARGVGTLIRSDTVARAGARRGSALLLVPTEVQDYRLARKTTSPQCQGSTLAL